MCLSRKLRETLFGMRIFVQWFRNNGFRPHDEFGMKRGRVLRHAYVALDRVRNGTGNPFERLCDVALNHRDPHECSRTCLSCRPCPPANDPSDGNHAKKCDETPSGFAHDRIREIRADQTDNECDTVCSDIGGKYSQWRISLRIPELGERHPEPTGGVQPFTHRKCSSSCNRSRPSGCVAKSDRGSDPRKTDEKTLEECR